MQYLEYLGREAPLPLAAQTPVTGPQSLLDRGPLASVVLLLTSAYCPNVIWISIVLPVFSHF